MKIALASPNFPTSTVNGLHIAAKLVKDAVMQGAEIICFPETFIPGYPLAGHQVPKASAEELRDALTRVCAIARENSIAIIMAMDWYEGDKFLNVAQVISANGELLGYQSKNQLDPSEDEVWDAGTQRGIFEVNGLKFGVTICHEGFRYPESVRWAARNGAHVVFHPHLTGSDFNGKQITTWGDPASPYYEKAMIMRAMENTIYFASVGYAMKYQEATSSIIAPDGTVVAYQPYGEAGVIVGEIDTEQATGKLAKRFKPELYK